jgi:hypothetical protein
MAYRGKKRKRHPNDRDKVKIIYADPQSERQSGFKTELVFEEQAEDRLEELRQELYG